LERVATIILNRNLPEVTDRLHDHLMEFDGDSTDIYIVEAGSDSSKLSVHSTWHADWEDAQQHGLRYGRGMNFGLSRLWYENRFKNYDAFFLLTNDTEFEQKPTLNPLMKIMHAHPKVGILSPCSDCWGEKLLLNEEPTKYFWFIHNNSLLMRREFIESVCNVTKPDHINFLFDGQNFRGYLSESELIAKAYANDWAAAITSTVWARENESYLINQSDLIKTENFQENTQLYISEGKEWLRNKYGFNSRWSMQQYVKSFYDKFFEFHPEYDAYKI
jgi:hypothetical protein